MDGGRIVVFKKPTRKKYWKKFKYLIMYLSRRYEEKKENEFIEELVTKNIKTYGKF